MQASDRRITRLDADSPPAHFDRQNKALFVAERLTFAYTGKAQIGGEDTSEWFQRQLSSRLSRGMNLDATLDEVAAMLSDYFVAHSPADGVQKHAFVGVGWTDDSFAKRVPMITWISNYFDDSGGAEPSAQPNFNRGTRLLGNDQPFDLHAAGVEMPGEAWIRLNALFGSDLERSADPAPAAETLIRAIRELANSNELVGKGVMLNNLPRAPGPPTGEVMLVGRLPDTEVRTFTYIPESGIFGHFFGPLAVSSDGAALGGFESVGGVGIDSQAGMSYQPASTPAPPKSAIGQRVRPFRLGRNDPCWCESGKKYKRCHGP